MSFLMVSYALPLEIVIAEEVKKEVVEEFGMVAVGVVAGVGDDDVAAGFFAAGPAVGDDGDLSKADEIVMLAMRNQQRHTDAMAPFVMVAMGHRPPHLHKVFFGNFL